MSTHHAMLTAECSPKCAFQHPHMGAVSEDIEFTIKLSQFDEWAQDVKAIIKTELAETEAYLQNQHNRNIKSCLPPGAFWLRFGGGTNTLLSTNTGTEDVVFVQWTLMTSALTPRIPGKQASISETIEQLSLCKYKARCSLYWFTRLIVFSKYQSCFLLVLQGLHTIKLAQSDHVLDMEP